MQPSGDLVGVLVELSARMELGHDDFQSRHPLIFVVIHRNSATIILDTERSILVDDHIDFGRMSCHRFVDAVVNNLVDQVVQSSRTGTADVHSGSLANRLDTFEDFNVRSGVVFFFVFAQSLTSLSWGSFASLFEFTG